MVVRKMKEKCKDAARMRREKERAEFVELSKLLPLPSSTTSQLDKASIIRLTSSYLRMRAAFPRGLGENWGHRELGKHFQKISHQQSNSNNGLQQYSLLDCQYNIMQQQQQQQLNQVRELGSLLLQTLDGFVFALHRDGKIMYISETASVHLGLPQIDLTGSSVFEYAHPSDHSDIKSILGLNESDKTELALISSANSEPHETQTNAATEHYELGRSFCMRMKCILPKRNAGLVNSGYKAIHCNGYLKVRSQFVPIAGGNASEIQQAQEESRGHNGFDKEWESYALVAVGHSLLPTASTEVKLTGNSFMFRANLDLKIYYIETPVVKLLGFEQIEMIGQSLYQFVHVNDTLSLESSHRLLLDKGQVVTKYYRLMRRDGGFVWIQSYATLVNNPRNMPKPQHIVSICFVLAENFLDQSGITSQQIKHQSANSSAPSETTSSNGKPSDSAGSSGYESASSLGGGRGQKSSNATGAQKRKEKYSAQRKFRRIKVGLGAQVNNSNGLAKKLIPNKSQSGSENMISICERCRANQYQCSCMLTNIITAPMTQTIGSTRRPSDDTCSIVSSVASTSISSNASSHHAAEFHQRTYNTDQQPCYGLSANSNQDLGNTIPMVSSLTSNCQQNENSRHLEMMKMTQQPQTCIYNQGFDSIQSNYNQAAIQFGDEQQEFLSNYHQVWPTTTTVNGLHMSDELYNQYQHDQILQGPQLEDERQIQAFNQINCNKSPQSFYFQHPADWFVHENQCSDHSKMSLSLAESQFNTTYHHCAGGDEGPTSHDDLIKASQYNASASYLAANNLASMTHHRSDVITNNSNDRYTMFTGSF